WYFSIGGGLVLLAYPLYRRDPVFVRGQCSGLPRYLRTLWLIRGARGHGWTLVGAGAGIDAGDHRSAGCASGADPHRPVRGRGAILALGAGSGLRLLSQAADDRLGDPGIDRNRRRRRVLGAA